MTHLKITQERERIEREAWDLRYDHLGHYDSWGYAFPCDADGRLLPLAEPGQQSLLYCQAHPEEFEPPHVSHRVWSFMQDRVGTCVCGRTVVCSDTLWNGCECGRWYDFGGSEIDAPRGGGYRYETGETLADIYTGKDEDY